MCSLLLFLEQHPNNLTTPYGCTMILARVRTTVSMPWNASNIRAYLIAQMHWFEAHCREMRQLVVNMPPPCVRPSNKKHDVCWRITARVWSLLWSGNAHMRQPWVSTMNYACLALFIRFSARKTNKHILSVGECVDQIPRQRETRAEPALVHKRSAPSPVGP